MSISSNQHPVMNETYFCQTITHHQASAEKIMRNYNIFHSTKALDCTTIQSCAFYLNMNMDTVFFQYKHILNEFQILTWTNFLLQARPSVLHSFQQIVKLASSKEIALFLDYDGTLSPIVNNPDRAFISDEVKCQCSLCLTIQQ